MILPFRIDDGFNAWLGSGRLQVVVAHGALTALTLLQIRINKGFWETALLPLP